MITFPERILVLLSFLAVANSSGQGTFVYDQQSADDAHFGELRPFIQTNQPMGQSFMPSLSGIDFVRLFTLDSSRNDLGAAIYVNLRSGSINGPILGSTLPVALPDGYVGRTNFLFDSRIALNPGETYYLQPVVQSGDLWITDAAYDPNQIGYTRGVAYFQGLPAPDFDLWFREGIIIPEPCTASLALAGIGVALCRMNRVRRKSQR